MLEIEIKACWSLSSDKSKGWKILNQSTDSHQAYKSEGCRILSFEIEIKALLVTKLKQKESKCVK